MCYQTLKNIELVVSTVLGKEWGMCIAKREAGVEDTLWKHLRAADTQPENWLLWEKQVSKDGAYMKTCMTNTWKYLEFPWWKTVVHLLIHPASICLASTICRVEKRQYIQFNQHLHPVESCIYVFNGKDQRKFLRASYTSSVIRVFPSNCLR